MTDIIGQPVYPPQPKVLVVVCDAATGATKRQDWVQADMVSHAPGDREIGIVSPEPIVLGHYHADVTKSPPVLVENPPLATAPVASYVVGTNLVATLQVDPGAVVTVAGVPFTANSQGVAAVTFPKLGQNFIKVALSGRVGWSGRVLVNALTTEKVQLAQAVDKDRNAKLMGKVTVDTVTLDADDKSLLSLLAIAVQAALALAQNKPFSVQWIASDNSLVTLTGAQVLKAAKAVSDQRATLFLAARSTKNAVTSAPTLGEAQTVLTQAGVATDL